MNRNSDFFVIAIPIVVVALVFYGVIKLYSSITCGFLYEDLVKETVEEIVEKRCVLK